ncbi:MAG: UDP-N-acetylmuramoyl-tripeptide--D-alanyl-D-alanine ligase, partial [Kangiellaceae bacterium]|nr:UDP-N-acetylmuramoyl-tripeptide--D-alanyl-D-alanine ligase [Kangiellaceae bacterium]
MISSSLKDIAFALNGRLIGEDIKVDHVFTDSRQDCSGGLFVALKGPHFDAHNFLDQVVEKGAAAIIVEKESILDVPQIVVENGQKALGDLARFNRDQLKAKFAAITGSSGKTTVKEMLASIVQNVGSVFATRGNFNNEIGAPLTLLEMDNSHQFGVIELGANHAGEIAYTAGITRPDVAMINNVAAAHLEGFGDLQGVARAKGEIYGEIKEGGVAVVNLDDQFSDYWLKNITSDVITYSVNSSADVYAENVKLDAEQRARFDLCYQNQSQPIQLSLVGEHNVNNALAASSCAIAMGISLSDIARGLAHSPVV